VPENPCQEAHDIQWAAKPVVWNEQLLKQPQKFLLPLYDRSLHVGAKVEVRGIADELPYLNTIPKTSPKEGGNVRRTVPVAR
jgi:hypothetical protein